jgi:hypothetical protein
MLGIVEVSLAVAIALLGGWHRFKIKALEEEIKKGAKEIYGHFDAMEDSLTQKFKDALDEFEDFAEEVVPESPDPFEAMEIMRANMINQVLGMGVNWIANKFTKVEMGVHQLENVDKPPSAEGEVWHDVDAEQQREELAEVAGSM